MSWLDRARNAIGRHDVNPEIDEELQFHIEEQTGLNIEAGMTPEAARRDALLRFGSRSRAREDAHDANVLSGVEHLLRDVGFAVRGLRKQPSFALTAILTLALGIGATTAIFTVVYNVLLRPLPFPEADRLVVVSYASTESPHWLFPGVVDAHYLGLRDANIGFASTTTFGSSDMTLTGAGESVRLTAAAVTPDFFRVLGVDAALGRGLAPADAEAAGPVVVLGDGVWKSRFGSDAAVLGRTVMLDGIAHTVVGIMPPGFSYPAQSALWTPLAVRLSPRVSFNRPVIARLKPGATIAQARAEWAAFASNLTPQRGSRGEWQARVVPFREAVIGDAKTPLLIFAGAVALVLFIACANVSNLLLMRVLSRRQELATRLALGASRGRVLRQLITETSVLALLGGIAGTLVTLAAVPALVALVPPGRLPRDSEIQIDGWVLAFTFATSLASGVILGLLPALQGTRAAASGPREGAAWSTRRSDWLRHTLVVGEVALALVLLVGAGLLVKSLVRLTSVDLGFQPSQVMTMTVAFPQATYPTADHLRGIHRQLLESISVLPGVNQAGIVNWLPLGNIMISGDMHLSDGRPLPPNYRVTKYGISEGYLPAMGIRILKGRDFNAADTAQSGGVAILTDSVARQLWPGEDVIGQEITLEDRPGPTDWLTVVGVAADVRQSGAKDEWAPAVYQPYQQVRRQFFLSQMTFVARTNGNGRGIAAAMRTALTAADPNLAPESMESMQSRLDRTIAEPRFQTRLLVVFSALALLLAAVGVYGVLAASVAERKREIGIRIAMGAGRTTLVRTVLQRVLILTGCGAVLGLAGAYALTRVLAKLLFEITPTDATAFVGAGALLVSVALVAGFVPARRASTVDPVRVLRAE
jgi:predicted permease